MSKHLLHVTLSPRQKVMCGLALMVAFIAVALEQWTFPAYDQWRQHVAVIQARAASYRRLSQNLAIKERVEEQFVRLPAEVFRTGSDEIMFCEFLRCIEIAAGPLLVKVEPSPVKEDGSYATYRVRLLLSGKLQEIIRFADELTRRTDAVGVESFSLRAIPGRNMCDCSFVLWMVRLSAPNPSARRAGATSATAPASRAAR